MALQVALSVQAAARLAILLDNAVGKGCAALGQACRRRPVCAAGEPAASSPSILAATLAFVVSRSASSSRTIASSTIRMNLSRAM